MTAYSIIDVDTHVTEAPDLWTSRVPAHMRDAVPRIQIDKRGRHMWYIGDQPVAKLGLSATAGVGDMKEPPDDYDEMHPGAYDAGDYASVRQLLEGLGEGLGPEQQTELRLLRARTQVDPVQLGIMLSCLVLFCVVAWRYVM